MSLNIIVAGTLISVYAYHGDLRRRSPREELHLWGNRIQPAAPLTVLDEAQQSVHSDLQYVSIQFEGRTCRRVVSCARGRVHGATGTGQYTLRAASRAGL